MVILSQLLQVLVSGDFWQLALRDGALLALPALGGVLSERSGVTNIAMEGMMLTGAFFSVVAALSFHNPWMAVIVAMLAGGAMALIHAFISIRFRADQIISGFAINIAAVGLTTFLNAKLSNFRGLPQVDPSGRLPTINVPLLDNIPFLGQVFFQQNIIVYVSLALLAIANLVLFRTRLGLRLRAVGEHPEAADTAGINVYRLRYGAVIMSGLLSGLAGAFLAIGIANIFNDNMTSGRGYIALAAMIFGKWTPWGAFVACMIFGVGDALAASTGVINVPQYFLQMVPYVLALVVLAGLVGRSTPPAADGIPYTPGGE
ncbi:MAG TPA: ABC transporter permease [Ktedonobacterales bacterium]|nr:ABC transporter permease [Ktedonobacterales bacterium]